MAAVKDKAAHTFAGLRGSPATLSQYFNPHRMLLPFAVNDDKYDFFVIYFNCTYIVQAREVILKA